jgi:hypothetical protein
MVCRRRGPSALYRGEILLYSMVRKSLGRELAMKSPNNRALYAAVPLVCRSVSMVGLFQISLAFASNVSVWTFENCCTRSTDVPSWSLSMVAGYHVSFCLLMWKRLRVGMSSFAEPLYRGLRLAQAICSYLALSQGSSSWGGSGGGGN